MRSRHPRSNTQATEFGDEARLFGDADGGQRGDGAFVGVGPAKQGFNTGDQPIGCTDDRLVRDVQVTAAEGCPQVLVQGHALVGLVSSPQVDHLVGGSALALGLVHRGVRINNQLVANSSTGSGVSDADTGSDTELRVGESERGGERLIDPSGQPFDVAGVSHVLAQDHELITRDPGKGVPGPQQCGESVRDSNQQRVSGRVAVGVVDPLEAVEVSEQDRRRTVRALSKGGGVLEALSEQHAVGQPGQRVVQSTVSEPVTDLAGILA